MAAHTELHRVRLFGLLLLVSNLFSALLVRALGGSLRALGRTGGFQGEALALTLILTGASVTGTLVVSMVLGSCFWTYYQKGDSNPIVGEDFMPSYADLALIVALLVTCCLVLVFAV